MFATWIRHLCKLEKNENACFFGSAGYDLIGDIKHLNVLFFYFDGFISSLI